MLTVSVDEVLLFNPELDRQAVTILARDGLAMARRVAPCIDDESFPHVDAAKAIIRSAVLRWAESGSGGVSSEQNTAGPFSHTVSFDNRSTRRSLFYLLEIKELEGLCASARGRVGAVDTIPKPTSGCVGPGCTYVAGSSFLVCSDT